ncbi:MAG: glycosyltransferase family 2 protein [Planctomycetes bacterium]|nr:glycosyltransferase family 2 protein [Planctomycetota bacterium]
MSAPRVSGGTVAVVLNWNGAEHTLRCVAALERSRPRAPAVVVVDNASDDDSVARIKAALPHVKLHVAASNLGYGGGINVGIRLALERGAERVLVLNNDVEVEPDCVAHLESALDADDRIGIVGPMVLLPGDERRIWAAGGEVTHRQNVSRLRGHGRVWNGCFRDDAPVDYVPGAALLVRRAVFERAGVFDESFFCYMEDVEFGQRAARAGFENRYVARAIAVHDASASTGGGYTAARKYMNAVNSVHFLRRHGSVRGWIGLVVFDVLAWPLAFVVAAARGRGGAAWAKLVGLKDGWLGRAVTPERAQRFMKTGARRA